MWQEYFIPSSVEEALDILCSRAGQARVIAGGTDLVLQVQRGECAFEAAVDITRIPGLDKIALEEGPEAVRPAHDGGERVLLGATVTHAQAASSPLIKERAGVLAEACRRVGSPQIRNVGTVVGNVVNARPAADAAVALFALGAEAEITSQTGSYWTPISEIYEGVGVCRVDSCSEIVTALRFPALSTRHGWGFERLTQRRAVILPILVVAAVVALEDGLCLSARIAIGPVAPTPFRASQAEEVLTGKSLEESLIRRAAQAAAEASNPRDSILRGSREYRIEMVEVLTRRALSRAVEMARQADHP